MKLLILLTILLSHGLNLIPLLRKLSRHEVPTAVDFTALSFVLYFDLGLTCEAAGYNYRMDLLEPFFDATLERQVFAVFLIVAGPWILRLGALVTTGNDSREQAGRPSIAVSRNHTFYAVMIVICSATALYGARALGSAGTIWADRAQLAATAGPFIVLLYVPMYALGFFAQLRDASTFGGRCFSVFLIVTSVLSTAALGERTLILLPLLIMTLAKPRLRIGQITIAGLVAITLAAMLLPVFKWQFSTGETPSEMVSSVIYGDFYRGPILIRSMENSEMFGTRTMHYAGAGYVYAALFPVPRRIAPFKGNSTATRFTAYLSNDIPETTTWQLGVGAMDELMLNFGYVFVIPGLLAYGAAFGFLGRMGDVIPGLKITPGIRLPLRLAAIWFLGYDLPALLLIYGFMTLVCLFLASIWIDRHSLPIVEKCEQTASMKQTLPTVHIYRTD